MEEALADAAAVDWGSLARLSRTWRRAMMLQRAAFLILFIATLLVAAAALFVIGAIVVRGAGALSWSFLTTIIGAAMPRIRLPE